MLETDIPTLAFTSMIYAVAEMAGAAATGHGFINVDIQMRTKVPHKAVHEAPSRQAISSRPPFHTPSFRPDEFFPMP